MNKVTEINNELNTCEVEEYLGYKIEIIPTLSRGYYHPYGLRSEHGGVYFTGSYSKILNHARDIIDKARNYKSK